MSWIYIFPILYTQTTVTCTSPTLVYCLSLKIAYLVRTGAIYAARNNSLSPLVIGLPWTEPSTVANIYGRDFTLYTKWPKFLPHVGDLSIISHIWISPVFVYYNIHVCVVSAYAAIFYRDTHLQWQLYSIKLCVLMCLCIITIADFVI